jgi:hypothetical protein
MKDLTEYVGRGHRARPARIEREVSHDLLQLFLSDAVLKGTLHMKWHLQRIIARDKRGHCHQAAVALAQSLPFPHITEENIAAKFG